MSGQEQNVDEWWGELSRTSRMAMQEIIRIAEDLLDGEVLRITFNGQAFALVLKSESRRNPTIQPGRAGGRMRPVAAEPDEWWAGLPVEERGFVRELARIMTKLRGHPRESVNIRNDGKVYSVEHSVEFKATGGRAETN